MADWLENKGAGPWPFEEQGNVFGYLNNPRWTDAPGPPVDYTGREDEEPQIWDIGDQNNHIVVTNKFSKDHKPCKHWHKKPIAVPGPEIPEFEIYFELFPNSVSQPDLAPYVNLLSSESFIPINVDNFDGNLIWQFEVIGFNSHAFDITLQVVDSVGNICSSIVLPSGTVGPTGYELYRFRSDFISFIHNDSIMYGVKIVIPDGEILNQSPLKCVVSVARIIIKQSNATKTNMQIPLFGSTYNYILQECDNPPYDCPVGWSVDDPHNPEISQGYYNYKNASLWKYDSSELSKISKVIFAPAAEGATRTSTSKQMSIFATLDFQHFHYMLYSTTADDGDRADATPGFWVDETQVHTDNVSGLVYTPIPGSLVHWDSGSDPYPFTYTRTPDLSSLGPGTHKIMIGGELYIGLPVENQWEHWSTFFTLTIPVGYCVDNFILTVYSTLGNNMTWKVTYAMSPIGNTDLTLSLYDVTAGSIVSGSKLVWVVDEGFSRKFAELSPSKLINGHEYRLAINLTADFIAGPGGRTKPPDIMDAQLLLSIDSIEHLTTWRRCLSQYIVLWDNWAIPNAWGADHWGCSDGSICISPRMLMFYSEGSKVYFEATAFGENAWQAGQEAFMRVFLEDLGIDGSSGSTGSDVDGSLLEWSEDIEHKLLRKRTGELVVVNDNEYGNRQPDACYESLKFPNGFIVTKII